MNYAYKTSDQISEMYQAPDHKYPKYGKSTTDPTYYEPSATRIANMKKSSGMQLEGIYDFYSKDDVEKFNESNFGKNINNATVDPMFVKGLTREEISQVTETMSQNAQEVLDNIKAEQKQKVDNIKQSVAEGS